MPINKYSAKNTGLAALFFSMATFIFIGEAIATAFDGGIPVGWTCTGNCGTGSASVTGGVVTTSPEGGSYGWVASNTGVTGLGLPAIPSDSNGNNATDGSRLHTSVFFANAGDTLHFYFNFVTSDGAGYADYAWAELLDTSLNDVAHLFTARTTPAGNTVPGFGMPAIEATINPATVTVVPGGPVWSPLGGYSGSCWAIGCGYTGWVESTFTIAAAGNYILEFGVVDWADQIYDSGMAFDGITVGGKPIDPGVVPEPASLALLGIGLVGLGAMRHRKKLAR